MQDGTIRKHHGSWTLFYYDTVIKKGVKKRVRLSKKLAPDTPEFTKTKVRQLADDILDPINRKQVTPESSLSVSFYIEDYYFPGVEHELRPSTLHNYKVSIYYKHLKSKLAVLKLRDARPVHFQRMLRDMPGIGHLTLLHIKNFLSGVFRFASREGHYEGLNPLLDVTVPGRAKKFQGAAYTLSEFERMIEDIQATTNNVIKGKEAKVAAESQLACEVIGLMFLTGLRQSEARALKWSDWDEQAMTLKIQRSVWNNRLGPTKNPESEGAIPVLPLLKELLDARRERIKPRPDDYIFAGSKRHAPLNFHNLENRVIKPALKGGQFVDKNGDRLPGSGVDWKGWHGFRRGLATNLFDLGIHPALIGAILRHGDVATTMKYYIKDRGIETRAALEKFESIIRNRPSGLLVNQIDPTKDAQNSSQRP